MRPDEDQNHSAKDISTETKNRGLDKKIAA
jgi:hypothetical protein